MRLPLFVRLSATDWLKTASWDIEQSIRLGSILRKEGVDLIDCSSGGLVPHAHIHPSPGFQVSFAERIRKESVIMTGAVGLITSAEQAETILESGQADIVLMGREFLRDPYWPLHAGAELKQHLLWPERYRQALT